MRLVTVDRTLERALLALAAGLVANTLLGPLAFDLVDYGLSESLRNQAIGLEAVSFLLVAPVCIAAAGFVRAARPAGAVLALAPATYTAYMAVQYVVGPGYLRYPTVLALHLGLFVVGGIVAVRAWASIEPGHLPPMTASRRRQRAAVLVGLGVFVVPAAIATAIVLRRGTPTAAKAMYGLVGWFALVPPSVAAMAITMVVNDDPHASVGSTVLFGAAAVAFAVYAVRLFRPLFAPRPSNPRSHDNGNSTSPGRLRVAARVDR